MPRFLIDSLHWQQPVRREGSSCSSAAPCQGPAQAALPSSTQPPLAASCPVLPSSYLKVQGLGLVVGFLALGFFCCCCYFFQNYPTWCHFPLANTPAGLRLTYVTGGGRRRRGSQRVRAVSQDPVYSSIPSRGSPGLSRIGGAVLPQQIRKWSLWGFKFLPSHALVWRMSLQNAFSPGSQTGNWLRCGRSCLLKWRMWLIAFIFMPPTSQINYFWPSQNGTVRIALPRPWRLIEEHGSVKATFHERGRSKTASWGKKLSCCCRLCSRVALRVVPLCLFCVVGF